MKKIVISGSVKLEKEVNYWVNFIEEKNYDYMTSLGADENGYYKLQSLIYPCTVIKEEGAEDGQ